MKLAVSEPAPWTQLIAVHVGGGVTQWIDRGYVLGTCPRPLYRSLVYPESGIAKATKCSARDPVPSLGLTKMKCTYALGHSTLCVVYLWLCVVVVLNSARHCALLIRVSRYQYHASYSIYVLYTYHSRQ